MPTHKPAGKVTVLVNPLDSIHVLEGKLKSESGRPDKVEKYLRLVSGVERMHDEFGRYIDEAACSSGGGDVLLVVNTPDSGIDLNVSRHDIEARIQLLQKAQNLGLAERLVVDLVSRGFEKFGTNFMYFAGYFETVHFWFGLTGYALTSETVLEAAGEITEFDVYKFATGLAFLAGIPRVRDRVAIRSDVGMGIAGFGATPQFDEAVDKYLLLYALQHKINDPRSLFV